MGGPLSNIGGAQFFFSTYSNVIFFFFVGAGAPPSHYMAPPLASVEWERGWGRIGEEGREWRGGTACAMGGQIFLPVWGIRTREKERGERQVWIEREKLAVCSGWPDSLADLGKGDEREREREKKDGVVWFRLKEREAVNVKVNRFLLNGSCMCLFIFLTPIPICRNCCRLMCKKFLSF